MNFIIGAILGAWLGFWPAMGWTLLIILVMAVLSPEKPQKEAR